MLLHMVVYHNITDGTIVIFFVADTHHETIHPIVKDSFGDVKCQFLLAHIIEEGFEFEISNGQYVI